MLAGIAGYLGEFATVVNRIDPLAIERLASRIRLTSDAGGLVYTLGNGGSAATASHFALDLAKNANRPDRRKIRVFALTDNTGLITAWANDAHYDQVFAAQLESVVRPEDLIIAISASGNSRNVLEAVRIANKADAYSFGITGFAGGNLVREVNDCIIVPSDNLQIIEDAHLAIGHAIMRALRDAG